MHDIEYLNSKLDRFYKVIDRVISFTRRATGIKKTQESGVKTGDLGVFNARLTGDSLVLTEDSCVIPALISKKFFERFYLIWVKKHNYYV